MISLYLWAIAGLASEVLGGERGDNAEEEKRPLCLVVCWLRTQSGAREPGLESPIITSQLHNHEATVLSSVEQG